MIKKKLQLSFYLNKDVIKISQRLLGKVLVTNINNKLTSGVITETEAYAGINDKASHAYDNKRTKRTEIMYQKGGCCYIYLCYGIHHLFNIITNAEGIPHAILIRAVEPLEGIDIMLKRRKQKKDRNQNHQTMIPTTIRSLLEELILHCSLTWITPNNPNQVPSRIAGRRAIPCTRPPALLT